MTLSATIHIVNQNFTEKYFDKSSEEYVALTTEMTNYVGNIKIYILV